MYLEIKARVGRPVQYLIDGEQVTQAQYLRAEHGGMADQAHSFLEQNRLLVSLIKGYREHAFSGYDYADCIDSEWEQEMRQLDELTKACGIADLDTKGYRNKP